MKQILKTYISFTFFTLFILASSTCFSQEKPKETHSNNLPKYNLLVYTSKDCERCDTLIQKLTNKQIDFVELDIDSKDNLLSSQFWDNMYFKGYNRKNIRLPFVIKNNRLHHPISDFDKFIEKITKKRKRKTSIF